MSTQLAEAALEVLTELETPRPRAEYHDDMGPVLWWKLEVEDTPQAIAQGWSKRWAGEPPYVGTPNDCGFTVHVETKIATSCTSNENPRSMARRFDVGGWPGYHTHFTPIPMPKAPA